MGQGSAIMQSTNSCNGTKEIATKDKYKIINCQRNELRESVLWER